jgi:hypothetical protein
MKKSIYTLLILSICFNSCKDNITSPNPKIEGIIPLAVGNTWVYKNVTYNWNEFDTMKVVRDSIIGDERWYAIRHSFSSWDEFYTNRIDGLYLLSSFPTSPPTAYKYFKYPSSVGDSSVVNEGMVLKLVSNSDTVRVNGQQFICFTYLQYILYGSERDTTGYRLIYMMPKVGIIKRDYYSSNNKSDNSYVLIDYKLY